MCIRDSGKADGGADHGAERPEGRHAAASLIEAEARKLIGAQHTENRSQQAEAVVMDGRVGIPRLEIEDQDVYKRQAQDERARQQRALSAQSARVF